MYAESGTDKTLAMTSLGSDRKGEVYLMDSDGRHSTQQSALESSNSGSSLTMSRDDEVYYTPDSSYRGSEARRKYPTQSSHHGMARDGRTKYPPRVAFEEHSHHMQENRPGWRDSSRQDFSHYQARGPPPFRRTIIYHLCYAKGHISLECPLPLRELATVRENYSRLTPDERSLVPDTSYQIAAWNKTTTGAGTLSSQPRENTQAPAPTASTQPTTQAQKN